MSSLRCRVLVGWLGLLALVVLTAPGCSSKGNVSGKVFYKGALLKGGNVTFTSSKGTRSARINEDGTYSIPDAPTGEVKIAVETASLKPKTGRPAPKYSPPKDAAPPAGGYDPSKREDRSHLYTEIPPAYADPEKSGKTATIKGGKQELDINLD